MLFGSHRIRVEVDSNDGLLCFKSVYRTDIQNNIKYGADFNSLFTPKQCCEIFYPDGYAERLFYDCRTVDSDTVALLLNTLEYLFIDCLENTIVANTGINRRRTFFCPQKTLNGQCPL